MKVLILGGTWFIGKHITEYLIKTNYEVWHFNRGKTPIEDVHLLKGDRFNDDTKSLRGHSFDIIIDLTCFTEPDFYNTYKYLQNNFKKYILISNLNYDNTEFYINRLKVEKVVSKIENYIIIKLKNVVGEYDYSNRFYNKNNKWYLKSTHQQLSLSSYVEAKAIAKYIEEIIKKNINNKIFTINQRRGLQELYN